MQDWSLLSRQSTTTIRSLQNQKLAYLSRYLLPFHPFYRAKDKGRYLKLRKISDLVELGLTSKIDLLPTEEKPAKAREFILQPNLELIKQSWPKLTLLDLAVRKAFGADIKEELEIEFKPIHTHFTTGRSSAQIPFFYSARDLKNLNETGRRLVETIGAPADSVVINAFPFAPHLAFWLAEAATRASRLLSVQTGGGKILGTNKILDLTERLKGTILIAMPGYCYHLLTEAAEQKRDLSSLRYIILGGEKIAPGLRAKMKQLLTECGANSKKIKILGTYALTEGKTAWVQCDESSGYHLYPDLEYIELIDDNGQPVEEGQPGEVTYTSLDWRASTLVRYRTGDICNGLIRSKPCPHCGRTTPRLDSKIERKFDTIGINLTKVKGELINLATFAELIHGQANIGEWQVELSKKNNDPFEVDELTLYISIKGKANPEKTKTELQTKVLETMLVSPVVVVETHTEIVKRLGLETELKEKRVIDRRKDAELSQKK